MRPSLPPPWHCTVHFTLRTGYHNFCSTPRRSGGTRRIQRVRTDHFPPTGEVFIAPSSRSTGQELLRWGSVWFCDQDERRQSISLSSTRGPISHGYTPAARIHSGETPPRTPASCDLRPQRLVVRCSAVCSVIDFKQLLRAGYPFQGALVASRRAITNSFRECQHFHVLCPDQVEKITPATA